jgi:hypothetical protein
MNDTAQQAAAQAGNVAFVVIAIIQLFATGGIGLWLIKKISNLGENLAGISERVGGLEAVFGYMREDHDSLIRIDERQKILKKKVEELSEH